MTKNAAKNISEFLSIAAHQLRTPLTAIKGYLSMLIDGDYGELQRKQKEVIKDLIFESSRLGGIIDAFLNASAIEAKSFKLNMEEIDIDKLARSAVKEVGILAKDKGLNLVYGYNGEVPLIIDGDKDRIYSVIINLLDNAIKYTESGKVEVSIERKGGWLELTVEDTGIGIEKRDLNRVFNKFSRGASASEGDFKGTGLGLYIAKIIIESHKGKIRAVSRGVGNGSRFVVSLKMKNGAEKSASGPGAYLRPSKKIKNKLKK